MGPGRDNGWGRIDDGADDDAATDCVVLGPGEKKTQDLRAGR